MAKMLRKELAEEKFTFQYGSTQIALIRKPRASVAEFTFQYGSTQMRVMNVTNAIAQNLHSNMDLLK